MTNLLNINATRFKIFFDELAQIGATPMGGIQRTTFSQAHFEARDWFNHTVIDEGLDFQKDKAGNHIARLNCGSAESPTLILGSHLDSVPNGGRYDGALGVVAALEVLLIFRDSGMQLPFNLEAIDFTDEEGSITGLLGSFALTGKLTRQMLAEPRGGKEAFLDGLQRAGLTLAGLTSAQRDPAQIAGYLELHIEQGARLLDAGMEIGIVTSIVGINSYRLTFIGRADHAGTTPMDRRLDSAQGASAFILKLHEMVCTKFPDCTANVGQIHLEPGAFNIVPAKATLSLEFRVPDNQVFDQLDEAVMAIARQSADQYGLQLETNFLGKHDPAPMHPSMQQAIRNAAATLRLKSIPLTSGAGHDAQSLAHICPTGMIFVPSVGGASHSPREFTEWGDCLNGANVLLQTVLELGKS